jgi:hypothetical protein
VLGTKLPISFLTRPVYFLNPAHREAFIRAIDTEIKNSPRLIIIDTLARTIPPGNENDPGHMANYIAALDEIASHMLEVTILVIHHCGRNCDEPRGHSALDGAAQVMYSLKPGDNGLVLRTTKAPRNGKALAPLHLTRKQVTLVDKDGKPFRDEEGESLTSCVINEAGGAVSPGASSPFEAQALSALARLEGGARRGEWLRASGLAESTFDRVKDRLVTQGVVTKDGNRFVLSPPSSSVTINPPYRGDEDDGGDEGGGKVESA